MASPPSGITRVPLSGIHWHRVGRVALLLVLGVIVLLYIGPVTTWIEQRSTAGYAREELQHQQAENEALRRRLQTLRGPEAIERQARSLGMIKAGERAYVLEGR